MSVLVVVTIRAAVVIILGEEEFTGPDIEFVVLLSSIIIGGQKQLSKTSMYELVFGDSLQ